MIAALILTAAVVGLALLVVCAAWGPRDGVRRESLSERHDRLDAEALRATRAVSSNRKSGRTRAES